MPNEFLVQNGLWGTGKSDFSKRAPPAPALNPIDELHHVTSELEQIVIRMHKELGSEKDLEIKQLKAKLKETTALNSEITKLKKSAEAATEVSLQKYAYIKILEAECRNLRQELQDANELKKEVYEELGKEKRDNNATRKKPPKR
jgi:hypothetical protein